LQPLHPRYVSSVDSGNLAGHLLTLRPGLLALADERILPTRLFEGLHDTLEIVADATDAAAARQVAGLRRELESLCAAPPGSLAALRSSLERLATSAAALASARAGSGEAAPDYEARGWAEALAGQCRAAQDELMFLAPWLALPELPAGMAPACDSLADDPWADLKAIPTLRELATLDGRLAARIAAAPDAAQREALTAALGCVRQGSERARERIAAIEALALQARRIRASRLRLPVRQGAQPADHRLQRR